MGSRAGCVLRGSPRHPVFVALAETVRKCEIPKQTFVDLLTAFRQDQRVSRYSTFEDVLGYCRYSANPVGHLVLYVCGYRDAERQALSDFTCTALQLANFWQDVSPDYANGRIYLPLEDLRRFRVTEDDIAAQRNTSAFCDMMHFPSGARPRLVPSRAAADRAGGSRPGDRYRIVQPGRAGDSERRRSSGIQRTRQASFDFEIAQTGAGCGRGLEKAAEKKGMSTAVQPAPTPFAPTESQLAVAYSVCRHITRAAAKNFYYAFLVLPKRKASGPVRCLCLHAAL
jgi:hypothetical protein